VCGVAENMDVRYGILGVECGAEFVLRSPLFIGKFGSEWTE
jgi:hypothetical protein